MVGLRPSEAPVAIYQSTRRNIPEDINFSSLVPSKLIPTKTESHFANPITTDFNDKQLLPQYSVLSIIRTNGGKRVHR